MKKRITLALAGLGALTIIGAPAAHAGYCTTDVENNGQTSYTYCYGPYGRTVTVCYADQECLTN